MRIVILENSKPITVSLRVGLREYSLLLWPLFDHSDFQ